MAGERRESDFMNRSLDEIAAEMDSGLYDRDERDGHHRPQHRYSPYPADHVPSWRAEKEAGGNGGGAAPGAGDRAGEGCKVFVANLNYTVTWQRLKDHLKAVAPVLKCDLFRNIDGSSRGMGLVMFADREGADRAVQELNGSELDGRKIFLRKDMRMEDREKSGAVQAPSKPRPPINPSTTVFVANLDYSLTWQKLRDIFRVAGRIVHVEMMTDPDGQAKGCATVQFETTSDAMNAIILFHGQLLQNRPMIVRMDAKSPFQPDPIQLKLQAGKGGAARGFGAEPVAREQPGLLSSQPPPPLMGGAAPRMSGHVHHPPSLRDQSLGSSSSSSLSTQLPLLAALGLSALTNVRHFSPEQLSLLGLDASLLHGNGGKMGGAVGRGHSGFLGQRGLGNLPPLHEHGQEGLLSQHPFDSPRGLPERERNLPPLGGILPLQTPPPSSHYSSSMATDLSLATALGVPHHSSTLLHQRPEPPMIDTGRRGRKLFVRNLNFRTTWQVIKDYMKPAGPITFVELIKNEDGQPRGWAAVVFESERDAEKAIRMFDQTELEGRRISVTFDRSN